MQKLFWRRVTTYRLRGNDLLRPFKSHESLLLLMFAHKCEGPKSSTVSIKSACESMPELQEAGFPVVMRPRPTLNAI